MNRTVASLLAIGIALLLAITARADYLEIRRVAHVRAEPTSSALEVVVLEPGTHVELLDGGEQVDGWYHVELPSGDDGWVYRSLTRRFPGTFTNTKASTPSPIAPPSGADRFSISPSPGQTRLDELTIGSWNIKWFGQRETSEYDFDAIADFVEECDVVAIQEVRGDHAQECLDALMSRLDSRGKHFTYVISPMTGYSGNADEAKRDYLESFAFCWQPSRLKQRLAPRFASTPAVNHAVFRQVPYVCDFEVVGAKGFDFRLLTCHTVYNATISFVRTGELRWISDWLTTAGVTDAERELIAIGDFNANPKGQTADFRLVIPDESRFRVLMYESQQAGERSIRTTPALKTTSSDPTYFELPVYDHILVTHATAALPSNPMTRVGHAMGVWAFDQDPSWHQLGIETKDVISRVSDHRPIWFKMDFNAEDLDPD